MVWKELHDLPEQGLTSHIENREIVIEIDEITIAGFLASLADAQIEYSQISIDKPTLEDYFLSMSDKQNQNEHMQT